MPGDGLGEGLGLELAGGLCAGPGDGLVVEPGVELAVGLAVDAELTDRLYRKRALRCPSRHPTYTSQPDPHPGSTMCRLILRCGVRLINWMCPVTRSYSRIVDCPVAAKRPGLISSA